MSLLSPDSTATRNKLTKSLLALAYLENNEDMRENRTANSGIRAPDEHCAAIKTAITP